VLTLKQAARLYHVPITDYALHDEPDARGEGLLVSSGAGMMMAAMDCCPKLRWCVDIDGLRDRPSARVADFMLMAERVAEPIAVCGWFSITDPKPLRDAVLGLTKTAIVYTGNIRLRVPGEVLSFREFIAGIQAPHPRPHESRRTVQAKGAASAAEQRRARRAYR
jgi:hypothetical protein